MLPARIKGPPTKSKTPVVTLVTFLVHQSGMLFKGSLLTQTQYARQILKNDQNHLKTITPRFRLPNFSLFSTMLLNLEHKLSFWSIEHHYHDKQMFAEDLDRFKSSMCLALLYMRTPTKTMVVPRPDKNVTGLPNMMTESQMRSTRLAVLATLKINFTQL